MVKNNLILSCGHSVDSFRKSHCVVLKGEDKQHKKALKFSSVCSSCKNKYMKSGELFESEEEAFNWLTSNSI